MSQLSDTIERFIMEMMAEEGEAELQRNKLASQFQCAPSQINYVLSTRFTSQRGYIIESRRGGGGYIRIVRLKDDSRNLMAVLEEQIGDRLTRRTGRLILQRLLENGAITKQTAYAMDAAMMDENLMGLDANTRDEIRARIFKNMILASIGNER